MDCRGRESCFYSREKRERNYFCKSDVRDGVIDGFSVAIRKFINEISSVMGGSAESDTPRPVNRLIK